MGEHSDLILDQAMDGCMVSFSIWKWSRGAPPFDRKNANNFLARILNCTVHLQPHACLDESDPDIESSFLSSLRICLGLNLAMVGLARPEA